MLNHDGSGRGGGITRLPPAAEATQRELQTSLAALLKVTEDRIVNIRKTGTLYSLVDVTSVVVGCDNNSAGQRIREVRRQHPEFLAAMVVVQFPGRGQRETPAADLRGVVELIMLLPGKAASSLRRSAAELFVRYHGGDLTLIEEVAAAKERQLRLQREDPTHPLRAFGAAAEERVSAPSSSTAAVSSMPLPKRLRLSDETVSLWDEVRRSSGLTGQELMRRAMLVQTCFLELAKREAEADSSRARPQGASLSARHLRCTCAQLSLLHAAIAQADALSEEQDAVVARHFEDYTNSPGRLRAQTQQHREGFRVAGAEHAAAKDAANKAFITALRRHDLLSGGGNIFFLDHWAEELATSADQPPRLPPCRTAAALLRVGVEPCRLFSANKDLGVVEQLRRQGACAFHGDWRDALLDAEWPSGAFGGIYLDACGGSAGVLVEHLELLMTRAAAPRCVLAWTLVGRDFVGETLLRRVLRLLSFMHAKGWQPAADTHELSTLCHRSSASGQQVVTQVWVRGNV